MPAFIIVFVRQSDPERYLVEYVHPALELATTRFGCQLRAADDSAERVEGSVPGGTVIVMEFPDRERLDGFYSSPEYTELRATRQALSESDVVLVDGASPAAPRSDATQVARDEVAEFNRQTIEEFRNNAGKVGGVFEGATLLLLHSTGARSGVERINPLSYQTVGDSFAVFASKAGAPQNPDWYYNLVANPDATIEVGTDSIAVTARVAPDDERSRIWDKQKSISPVFATYETQTTRTIPVVVLEPRRED